MRGTLLLIALCLAQAVQAGRNIILETDMGNDVDDAWALDMLHKYADEGRVRLLAVMLNKEGVGPCRYVQLMNTWYGRPRIPIGHALRERKSMEGMPNFTGIVADMKAADGTPLYPHTISSLADTPDDPLPPPACQAEGPLGHHRQRGVQRQPGRPAAYQW